MRRFILSLLGVAALAIAAIAILPSLISSDWVRSELGRQLSAATGSSIAFNGPVNLSAFPYLAVVAEDVTLSAEAEGITAEFAEVSGSVALSSLWSDRLHIKQIALDRPVIVLEEKAADEAALTTAGSGHETGSGDPLPALVAFLERSAIESVSIASGTFILRSATNRDEVVSDIALTLSAPDIDDEFSLSASARMGERNYETSFTISTLRSLLERQPADVTVTAEADPAPAPGLTNFEASGQLTLNANGSYQIRGGEVDAGEQVFGLNALFVPGERARFLVDLEADRLDLTPFMDATPETSQSGAPAADTAKPANLQFLAGFDADMSINAAALTLGEISASDVSFSAALKDGKLTAKLGHLGIDAGSVAASVATDVTADDPVFRGRLASTGLNIAKLSALAGQTVPLSGALTIDAGFAFRGLDAEAVRKTADLTGTIGLRDAAYTLPGIADETMREVKAKKITARIESLAKPVRVAGRLDWRNKPVDVDLQIPAADTILTGNLSTEGMPFKLQVKMSDANLSLDGKAALSGTYAGKLGFSTADLSAFLAALGQSGAESIGPLAFNGHVDAGATGVSFQKATISVNGVEGAGGGSVEFTTPLKIKTALNFDELDLARLAGAQSPAPQAKASKGAEPADVPLDLSSLRSIDATIKVNAKKLGYGKVFAGPVATSLVVSDGVASLTLPEAPFYGGHVVASLRADGSQSEPSIALKTSISGASAAPLLTDMAGFKHLEGSLKAEFDVTGAGGTSGALAKSLQGNANVGFSDGAIRGIDIANVYNNLVSLMTSGFKQDESKATTFTELGASFAIEGGVARTEDLKLVGPLIRMTGNGAADLAQSTLNFRLEPRLVASLKGQGAEISTDGIGVPVVVEGSFAAPRIYPDLSDLLKNPDAALAKLKDFGLPIDKLPIGDLLNGDGAGAAVKDLLGGTLDKALKDKAFKQEQQQLSIEEIIGGDPAPKPDEAAVEIPTNEEAAKADAPTEQPANGTEVPSEEADGPMEGFFKQLLQ
ncbi:AsmA family protein [Sinorhizobium meliloti]|uniref:AsmA family protein n=1 Tax=Rhizobium meliloti TaxID=382 RepID=UPI000B4980E1|nr:AsmA family protein [Sinorhizobium meliloti]ASQ14612.1 membrane assembly protein AsmA [Sinorhizobium meliloti]MDW9445385.1 AsmA family protein [Sinorhizobium meliloti]MDW9572625.1 AsmA family protein [Sinorhizobium meliloti]MDX0285546.1 AsmA family protein [Sinorhizobium meliloti]MQU80438.1 AsmA family protein [Sinorhizobium meliloti]